jgi:Phosphoheptose isomerase
MIDNKVIRDYLDSQSQCIDELMRNSLPTIKKIFQILNKAKTNGNKIYIMGNGGSASTATHFASEFVKNQV